MDTDPSERLGVVRDHPAPLRRSHRGVTIAAKLRRVSSGARTRIAEHCDVRLPSSAVGKNSQAGWSELAEEFVCDFVGRAVE